MAITVVLVDDHAIVRQGLGAVISQEQDIKVIAEASNGKEAVDIAKKDPADIFIIDITMPILNGLEASSQIMQINPWNRIIILSMHDNRVFIERALNLGIRGYVLKDSAADEIIQAIRAVYKDEYFLSPRISTFVIQDYIDSKGRKIGEKKIVSLTEREREILQLVVEGYTNKEVAMHLKIALKTALAHRNNIMQKLGIHRQADLIRYALKEGITTI
ncbi:MAG: DNA-binding response regulator [Candidatus Omnitrophica bacterium CG02_land_8_20_14_3_00__42_8]|nr:MAG: DNA-binding response regulator [Candidatus Omnitrophica bacterium CG02_land_8_20_14_3_00__42_8]PIW68674.1 MAG: DNA-binding response regulator [Candidatus Omnitrophica bacterium CG12_big_fil_rev_8_21_14_0_65_42_8]